MDSYVVEPQSLFVPYLSDVLARAEMRVVRVAPHLDVEDIRRTEPEALFVDTDFLEVDPAEALSIVRESLPLAFICAYTDGEGASRPDRLRYAGANCVLSKRSGPREVLDTLRDAKAGKISTVRGEFDVPRLAEERD